jgi:radical SAM protein with 4Fe4S-binding SPASM domain
MMNIFKENRVISGKEFLEEYLDSEKTPFKFRKIVSKLPSEKCDDSSCKEPCTGGCPLIWKIFKPEEIIRDNGK